MRVIQEGRTPQVLYSRIPAWDASRRKVWSWWDRSVLLTVRGFDANKNGAPFTERSEFCLLGLITYLGHLRKLTGAIH